MSNVVLPVLLVIANVTGAGMIVPQVLRIARAGRLDGVSLPWAGVGIAMNLWWLAYAVAEQLWGIFPVSLGGLTLYAIIVGQILQILGVRALRPILLGATAIALLPLAGLLLGGWTAAGLAIGLCYSIQFAPAAWEAIRAPRLDGLSPTTWSLAWIEAAIWFGYGLHVGDGALVVGGGGGTVMATIILGAWWARGGRRSRPATFNPAMA